MSAISMILHTADWSVKPENNKFSWLDLTHWSKDYDINAKVRIYFDSVEDIDRWIHALTLIKEGYGYVMPKRTE